MKPPLSLKNFILLPRSFYDELREDGVWLTRACSIAFVRGTASRPVTVISAFCRSLLEVRRSVSRTFATLPISQNANKQNNVIYL
jgi:hypothetical protein